ncbi:MAG TPA: hypothetical protein VGQ28_18135 [Thermoanaerobaculia bacterium]|jgi:hypothetical protein|nr:hypothetical protein [Thermoanaerobaculia bacterium]
MKRNACAAAVLVLGVSLLGCVPSLADRSYSAARDSAQKALSLTFSVAAVVTNWLPERPEEKCRHCPRGPRQQESRASEDPGTPPDISI